MKYLPIVLTLAVVMIFYTACQKNETVTPAAKTTVKPDSTVQVTPTYTPHTDTFYGTVNSWNDAGGGYIGSSDAFIYAYYPSPDTITFSHSPSPYWNDGYGAITIALCFNTNYRIDSSNYYADSTDGNYSYFIIRNDSIIYQCYNNSVACTDVYTTAFSGAKK